MGTHVVSNACLLRFASRVLPLAVRKMRLLFSTLQSFFSFHGSFHEEVKCVYTLEQLIPLSVGFHFLDYRLNTSSFCSALALDRLSVYYQPPEGDTYGRRNRYLYLIHEVQKTNKEGIMLTKMYDRRTPRNYDQDANKLRKGR